MIKQIFILLSSGLVKVGMVPFGCCNWPTPRLVVHPEAFIESHLTLRLMPPSNQLGGSETLTRLYVNLPFFRNKSVQETALSALVRVS